MILKSENVIKKVDSLGRVTIPKGLRDRMMITDELEIYTMEYNGREYVCMAIPEDENDLKWRQAVKALEELGIEVPDELKEKIG